ncbi:MAG: hypothetical protein LUG15_04805 [Oscillospiraceae bacterium]|nr:hypothetical protein [Oscillospiraceae bacterium]
MAYKNKSDAIKYNNEYIKQAYDRINLTVPKGRKAEIQAAAEKQGQSVNGFIGRLIDRALAEQDGSAPERGAEPEREPEQGRGDL